MRCAKLFGLLALVTLASAAPANDAKAANPPPQATASRPFTIRVPKDYDPGTPAPLLVVLHGFGSTGERLARYWGVDALADAHGVLVSYPDGTANAEGRRFWNATDACCNFRHAAVDDVAYVTSIIDAAESQYNVDKTRIFVAGHSNGGFMAYKMACEMSDRVAGIVSVAGAALTDDAACKPTSPVAVLQVHGAIDSVIRMRGGTLFDLPVPRYPATRDTVAFWAKANGCTTPLAAHGPPIDIVRGLPGAETRVEAFGGCTAPVELWTIDGGPHIPNFSSAFGEAIYAFLAANPKTVDSPREAMQGR
jgi:polyhydroxybutyrate depolymerase